MKAYLRHMGEEDGRFLGEVSPLEISRLVEELSTHGVFIPEDDDDPCHEVSAQVVAPEGGRGDVWLDVVFQ